MTRTTKSVVAERLANWLGRVVDVRLSWEPSPRAELLAAVLPVGREYFVELVNDARVRRLVNVNAILEIAEIVS